MKPPETFTITVTVDIKNQRVMVNGPLHLKALCIHALSDAVKVVVDHVPQQQGAPAVENGKGVVPPVIIAQPGAMDRLKRILQ